jgi:hypothetical protein
MVTAEQVFTSTDRGPYIYEYVRKDLENTFGSLDDLPAELADTVSNVFFRYQETAIRIDHGQKNPGWHPEEGIANFTRTFAKISADYTAITESIQALREIRNKGNIWLYNYSIKYLIDEYKYNIHCGMKPGFVRWFYRLFKRTKDIQNIYNGLYVRNEQPNQSSVRKNNIYECKDVNLNTNSQAMAKMSIDDACVILGVRPEAPNAVIEASWRTLLDQNKSRKDNEANVINPMKRINDAFNLLMRTTLEERLHKYRKDKPVCNSDGSKPTNLSESGGWGCGATDYHVRDNPIYSKTSRHGFDRGTNKALNLPVPERPIYSWSWAGFLATWIWAWDNKYWPYIAIIACELLVITILKNYNYSLASVFLMYGISIYFGLKADELAWNSGRYNTVDAFYTKRKGWEKWGLIVGVPIFIFSFIINLGSFLR